MSETLAGRYGPPRSARARRATAAAAVAGGALVLALLVWIGAAMLRDPVQWSDVGFSVKGPDRVDVTFDVVKDPAASARCTIHALNSSFAEVGVITTTVGVEPQRVTRHTVTLATQELAVTGVVSSCEVAGAGTGAGANTGAK